MGEINYLFWLIAFDLELEIGLGDYMIWRGVGCESSTHRQHPDDGFPRRRWRPARSPAETFPDQLIEKRKKEKEINALGTRFVSARHSSSAEFLPNEISWANNWLNRMLAKGHTRALPRIRIGWLNWGEGGDRCRLSKHRSRCPFRCPCERLLRWFRQNGIPSCCRLIDKKKKKKKKSPKSQSVHSVIDKDPVELFFF